MMICRFVCSVRRRDRFCFCVFLCLQIGDLLYTSPLLSVEDIVVQRSKSISSSPLPGSRTLKTITKLHSTPLHPLPYTLHTSQPRPRQHRSTIRRNDTPIQMRRRPTGQKHHQASQILRVTQPAIRAHLRELLLPALQLHQPARHLRRIEARRDGVTEDMAGAQLDGQILGEVDGSGLGGRVRVRGVGAQRADADAGDRGGDDDARRILHRRALAEERREFLDRVEDALDVQVHDLGEGRGRVGFEALAPCCTGIREEDVDVRRLLPDLAGQTLDLRHLRQVGRHGDRDRVGPFVRQRVEGAHGFVARAGFARGDVDFGAAGLEEAVFSENDGGLVSLGVKRV